MSAEAEAKRMGREFVETVFLVLAVLLGIIAWPINMASEWCSAEAEKWS